MSTTVLPRPVWRRHGSSPLHRLRNLVRGRAEDPAWVRPALITLLLVTGVGYLWNLTASGDANSFYAAAVQAGTRSWKAFFFGSLDPSNFITVDKPPASLWVMALSGRVFGFSSFSMLAPQVMEGVLAVGLLYGAVRRWFGAGAGLMAATILTVTPVAALMFRFNNPDALLVCLLVASAYCLVRAIEKAGTRWMVAAGTLIGFAFLAKMMQAFLVLPAFALVYMVAAPTSLRRRVTQLLAGGMAIIVSAGWWVAIVALWPAVSRPMIDGSSDNSILNLIVGYNGLGRIFGASGPGGGGSNFSGPTGVLRLFNDVMAGQASWLLPAALLSMVGGLWLTRHRPRLDHTRAGLLLWGGWLVVSGLVFSLGSGVIHTYYTVALAPAIAALAAIGAAGLWRQRRRVDARLALALAVVVTAAWSWIVLDRTPQWEPWLRPLVIVSTILFLGALFSPARVRRRAAAVTGLLGAIACLAAPVAYSAQTITTAHTGSVPSAGPAAAGSTGFGGGGAPGSVRAGRGGGAAGGPAGVRGQSESTRALDRALQSQAGKYRWVAATSGSQSAASLELATGGDPVMAIGGFSGQGGNVSLHQFKAYVAHGEIHYYVAAGNGGGFPGGGLHGGAGFPRGGGSGPGGGFGAPGAGSPAGGSAATAAPRGITGRPAGGPGATSSSTSSITSWVKAHFKSETIGGQKVYDLSQPTKS